MNESTIKDNTAAEPTVWDNFPPISREFLDAMKELYDIRQIIRYSPNQDYLKGIQDVISGLELKYKEQNNIE